MSQAIGVEEIRSENSNFGEEGRYALPLVLDFALPAFRLDGSRFSTVQ
jgi:hypothetical protein